MNIMYDVIVVGAGHAGCEAANIAAKLGSKVLLITMNMETIAKMSCNPAMGGVAKGQIVREIDALGGLSGIVSDHSMMQFRMLNTSKGPAMWSPRSQNDRSLFSLKWRELLEHNLNIDFVQDSVNEMIISKNTITGVKTTAGNTYTAKSVILTSGTFMNGIIQSLINQWPALTGLVVIAFVFWTLFKKYLEENKTLLEGVRSLSTDHRSSIDQVLERYRLLSDDQVAEIARLRSLVTSLVDENEKIGKRYDDIRDQFSRVSIENKGLKRAVENVEEMLRATGGDVKMISTQLQKAQEDIDDVTKLLEHKPEKDA